MVEGVAGTSDEGPMATHWTMSTGMTTAMSPSLKEQQWSIGPPVMILCNTLVW